MTPAEMGAERLAELQRAVQAIAAPQATFLEWFTSAMVVTFRDEEAIGLEFGGDRFLAVDVDGNVSLSRAELIYLARIAEQVDGYVNPRTDVGGHQIGAGATHG